MSKVRVFGKILIIFVLGVSVGFVSFDVFELRKAKDDDNLVIIEASGAANWLVNDFTPLDPEKYGTPDNPLGLDLLPLDNRAISEDGGSFTTLKYPGHFSFTKLPASGSIKMIAKDLTAFDSLDSKDEATLEARFESPSGEKFRVVMSKLVPASYPLDTLGGVGSNVIVHGSNTIGTSTILSEFAYTIFWGFGDVYRNGKLVSTDRLTFAMLSERYQNEKVTEESYDGYAPGLLQVHLVLVGSNKEGNVHGLIPTGEVSPNGEEQPFIHINFIENIKVKGNKFLSHLNQ